MSEQQNGGSAFPDFKQEGMTLRDYFAAQLMPFVLSKDERGYEERCAVKAYRIADIMIAERAK